jgi:hypothetical protein
MATSNQQRVATRLGESALTGVRGAAVRAVAHPVAKRTRWTETQVRTDSGCYCSHTRSTRWSVPSFERRVNARKGETQCGHRRPRGAYRSWSTRSVPTSGPRHDGRPNA